MKFTATDILFMIFIGPIPPSFLKTDPPPQEPIQDLEVPSTKIGTKIGVLFGRARIPKLHVVWWGDVKIVKVKVNSDSKK